MRLLKRLIAFSLFFLAVPSFAGMVITNAPHAVAAGGVNITVIQSTGNASGSTAAMPLTLASNGTSGSTLVIEAMSNSGGGAQPLVTPTGFTLASSATIGNFCMYYWSKKNFSVGVASASVDTVSAGVAAITASMVEYSNMGTTPAVEHVFASGTGTSASAATAITGTGCIVMGVASHDSGSSPTLTAANSFTMRHAVRQSVTLISEGLVDYGSGANVNTGTYTPTVTIGASANWAMLTQGFCQ